MIDFSDLSLNLPKKAGSIFSQLLTSSEKSDLDQNDRTKKRLNLNLNFELWIRVGKSFK